MNEVPLLVLLPQIVVGSSSWYCSSSSVLAGIRFFSGDGAGRATPVANTWAPSARVAALGQLVPDWQVKAARVPFSPPALTVEHEAPDEVSHAWEPWLLPVLGLG